MRFIFIVLLIFIFSSSFSQSGLSTKSKKAIQLYQEADNYRVHQQFNEALVLLRQAIAKDKNFEEAYQRMGIVYKNMNLLPEASESYERALALTRTPSKQLNYWYELGEIYFLRGNYDRALDLLTRFTSRPSQSRVRTAQANRLIQSATFAKSQPFVTGYTVQRMNDTINHFFMQYFPVLTADQQTMLFTMRRGPGAYDDEELVITQKKDNHWTLPTLISENINSNLNEGTAAVSGDGRRLIFTTCLGRGGFGSCDLFESRKIGTEWTKPVNLGDGVNTSSWESQPALSADGRTLFFISDRKSGAGGRDIYVSDIGEDGKWGPARNLGPPINTSYDEMSPFIHSSGRVLFFASDGHPGFGGYDVFYSEKTSNGWGAPVNMGRPINNYEDQYSLFITADGEKGYYSHEDVTPGGIPRGQIYEVDIPEERRIKYKSNYVKGVVTSSRTKQPLDASIEMINLDEDKTESLVRSDSISGEYLITLTKGARYALYVNRAGYLFKSVHFDYAGEQNVAPVVLNIELEEVKEGSSTVLNNIFFEFNEYKLKDESKTELQQLIIFLNENPKTRIEISGHTDNVGTDAYNDQLSQKRAESVFQFLVAHGIDAKRLVSKGYGSRVPVASNDTQPGRDLNRRIVFKILR